MRELRSEGVQWPQQTLLSQCQCIVRDGESDRRRAARWNVDVSVRFLAFELYGLRAVYCVRSDWSDGCCRGV